MFKRVVLYAATNLAVMFLLGIIFSLLYFFDVIPNFDVEYLGLMFVALFYGFGGSIISLFLSKTVAKWTTKARVIGQPQTELEHWLVTTVGREAQQARIGMPEVAIYDAPEMNAFATGWSKNSALVAVSTGLLQGMGRDEIEAVLAHEVSHAANGDMVTLALVQGVLNTFVIFFSRVIGLMVDKAVFRTRRGYGIGYYVTVLFAQLVLGLFATVIVMWFSRWREYRADAGSAGLVGAPKMISALSRLAQSEDGQLPKAVAAFGIRGGKRGWLGLFASHPPLEDRIARLQAKLGYAAPAPYYRGY